MPLSSVAVQAEQIVREAGALARTFFDTTLTVRPKELPGDIVTNADYAVEELILSRLHKQFVGDGIVAEESGNVADSGTHYRWIVDPIDGTINFSKHIPDFGVMLCRAYESQLELGIIYLPMEEVMIVGERGQGVWCNGQQVNPVKAPSLSALSLVAGVNTYRPGDDLLNTIISYWASSGQVLVQSRRSAAINIAMVVRGECQGYMTNMHSPWDIAPLFMLLTELGYTVIGIGTREEPTWEHVTGAYAAVPATLSSEFRTWVAQHVI